MRRQQRRLAHQMKDFQHRISKRVVENTHANTIIIGDLEVKKMACKKPGMGNPCANLANRTLNHSLQNTGSLGRFARFLTYKAKRIGKRIIEIDESFTTKTCFNCGRIRDRRLADRVICCDCGIVIGRDHNSAVNIMLRFLLHQPPVNGEPLKQKFLDGLHRYTAPWVVDPVVDSMEAPTFRAG